MALTCGSGISAQQVADEDEDGGENEAEGDDMRQQQREAWWLGSVSWGQAAWVPVQLSFLHMFGKTFTLSML